MLFDRCRSAVINIDDSYSGVVMAGSCENKITYSAKDPSAGLYASNIDLEISGISFDLVHKEETRRVRLAIPGMFSVYNALAAAAAAYVMNVDGESVALGLAGFTGAGRRMEFKGHFQGADIYDDYAHHPGELHALIDAVRTMGYKRVIVAFQPHTYTRTKALFNDFVKELRVPDVVVLAEIYAAREQNDIGISSMDLSREIPGSVYCPTLDKVTAALARIACPGDLILTVGAGDIFKAGEKLLKEEK